LLEAGRWANNRVENSHLSLRRRERSMLRFRRWRSLQKFASVQANVHNHFNLENHLVDRQSFKERRSAAMAEWRNGGFSRPRRPRAKAELHRGESVRIVLTFPSRRTTGGTLLERAKSVKIF
jgi:hypothetical protein